ncbi:MAG: LacI family transcriptional regulator [Firmicutes bacterium]|nr:LacI family transcriptional regulator [Bacillota bacterium]
MSTIKDVAKKARVAPSTVSYVLTNSKKITEETRQRVIRAVKELNYVPNGVARSMKSRNTYLIGLLLSDVAHHLSFAIAKGVDEVAFKANYNVIFCNTHNESERESQYIRLLEERQVQGIIVASRRTEELTHTYLKSRQIPIVYANRYEPGESVSCVLVDNEAGGYAATKHLVDLGHRKIGFISGPSGRSSSRDRQRGYEQALHEARIPVDRELIRLGEYSVESGYKAMQQLLELRPTAVFAANDNMAIGAVNCIVESGWRVPEDISVVGYDNSIQSTFVHPALTTVDVPLPQVGEVAARILLDEISGRSATPQSIRVKCNLIVRGSSGPVSQSKG